MGQLERYLGEGRLDIDNNAIKNLIRPAKLMAGTREVELLTLTRVLGKSILRRLPSRRSTQTKLHYTKKPPCEQGG